MLTQLPLQQMPSWHAHKMQTAQQTWSYPERKKHTKFYDCLLMWYIYVCVCVYVCIWNSKYYWDNILCGHNDLYSLWKPSLVKYNLNSDE